MYDVPSGENPVQNGSPSRNKVHLDVLVAGVPPPTANKPIHAGYPPPMANH
jgi:hypothetical protein